jgi:transaldolase
MKLFIDTADLNEIKEIASWGILDGVTTNPTLLAKCGRSLQDVIDEIFKLVDGPISLEVLSEKAEDMVTEAKQIISKIPQNYRKNVAIKIPMTSEGLKAVKILCKEGIKTNVTLIFSANQALLAAKAGATFVSPFIGRLDDNGQEGMRVIEEIMEIFCKSARLGADIATVPPDVLRKMIKHPLTDAGIKSFLKDWEKVKK